jgi:YesN/AraC family two-component response regulator
MSFKVVIIDDNVNTVKSLQISIDWKSIGLEVAGTAFNGIQGSELIKRASPDIIITDINMPNMDGLNMIESINMEDKNFLVIVITGYDKFQYASRAIKLSVFDFILKPIDDTELCNSLKRARQKLEDENSRNKQIAQIELNNLKVRLLSFLTTPTLDETINYSEKEIENANTYFIIIAQSATGISRPLLERIGCENFPGNITVISMMIEGYLILFCILKQEDHNWHKYSQNIGAKLLSYSPEINVAVSALHTSYKMANQAFLEAKKALLEKNVFARNQGIIYYTDSNISQHSRLAEIENIVVRIINDADGDNGYKILYESLLESTDGKIESIRVMLMIYCLKVIEYKLKNSHWPDSIDNLIYQISKITSIAEIEQWHADFIREVNNTTSKESSLLKLVRDVLNYIKLYAPEGLTLESTAKKFNISPNYLSTLIHKETGITYQQHVIRAKIYVAKQMLDDTRMKIEEIGHSIGYENYVSFYHAFKNAEGITPSEYRFRNKG